MNLLAPLALWGLLGLALPLLLHLRRRRVGRTIQVGSLKHLETLPTAERRGPRVRDPLRLLLRAAILALIVLVLAGPLFRGRGEATRPLILVDSGSTPALRDPLAKMGELVVADLSDPWEAIARVDDSLPPGIPLSIAATTSSDRFSGPRPRVRRKVEWIAVESPPDRMDRAGAAPLPHSADERRALDAAIAATTGSFGPLSDTAGWEGRLPRWWRDSLDAPAFPLAVARALAPGKALPPAVTLDVDQVTPSGTGASGGRTHPIDPHWWIWGMAVALFLVERLWSRRLEGAT